MVLFQGKLEGVKEGPTVILLPAHPASFAHKFLSQRVLASPGMQKYGRLVIKNSVLDSLVCSGDSLILETASPGTHKPKIVNESLVRFFCWEGGGVQWKPIELLIFQEGPEVGNPSDLCMKKDCLL